MTDPRPPGFSDVWPVDELPAGEVEELVKSCSSLYMHNMYSALATPETLEPVTALASSYAQLKSLALDSWAAVEPMLREVNLYLILCAVVHRICHP